MLIINRAEFDRLVAYEQSADSPDMRLGTLCSLEDLYPSDAIDPHGDGLYEVSDQIVKRCAEWGFYFASNHS